MTVSAPTPEPSEAEAAPGPGALSRLILEVNDAGVSYQQMAQRTAKDESLESLSKQYFQKLVKTPPVSPPNPRQMKAIAAALRKPEVVVKRAAAEQWLEYEATELSGYDEDTRTILVYVAGMPAEERRRWLRMIQASGHDSE
jgi:hypothetical protein